MAVEKPSRTTLRSTDVQRNFGDVIRRVFSGREHLIVERDGLPVVAIISAAEYETLMQERDRREARLARFEAAARAIGEHAERQGMTEEEFLAALEQTQDNVFRERYGDPDKD
jgi:prevent-host-death family protein